MPASIQLSECSYGKTSVRLVKVERHGARPEMKDLTVAIQTFGAFASAYSDGDNRLVLPTDTMKNTVYVLAREARIGEIEHFGMRLANHFLARNSHLTRVRISISESIWQKLGSNGKPKDSFQMSGPECRTAIVDSSRSGSSVEAGVKDLLVLKTSRSSFANFLKDEYTTLKETEDRLLSLNVNAQWSYKTGAQDAETPWKPIRDTLLDVFAAHDSRSVQHTLFAMGQAVLERFACVEEIRLSMANRHCLLVDLAPFKLDNPSEVFVPIEEPSGLIEAVLKRPSAQ
ncbi:MAG: factor-independent urate hydroxylase [Candidatus Angelobacter sp.]